MMQRGILIVIFKVFFGTFTHQLPNYSHMTSDCS
jgi:hypothetical protein